MEQQNGHSTSAGHQAAWAMDIPDDQWSTYQRVIAAARARRLPFALGGAFALATYAGRWRNTKDLDFFIAEETREGMVDMLNELGLCDYYDELAYDRGWIYRAHHEDTIVDVIWMTANRRSVVDEAWLTRGPEVTIRDERVRIIPVEELIFAKLYILQRDRCDWTDVLNLLYAAGATLDWRHLLDRLQDDTPLLAGALSVYSWLSPGRAAAIPSWVWDELKLPMPSGAEPHTDIQRVELLDSRPWFFSTIDPSILGA